jgi:hypothetical protein
VVNSSAAALSHFGLVVEPLRLEQPAAAPERVVARSHPQSQRVVNVVEPCSKPQLKA